MGIESVKVLVDQEWAKIESESPAGMEDVIWSYSLSPPFPLDWPPVRGSQFRCYAYAYGRIISERLADGCHVGAPWASIEISQQRMAPRVVVFSNKVKDIGIQGVEPLPESERSLFDKQSEVQRFLLSLEALPEEGSEETQNLRDYYSSWVRYNGVVVTKIRPQHRSFFKWLGCKQ